MSTPIKKKQHSASPPISPGDAWRRTALLATSIVLAGSGLMLSYSSVSASTLFAQGVLLKTGIVTFMWWLALPQLRKLSPLMLAITATFGMIAIVRPSVFVLILKVAIPLLPVLFLIWLFWIPKQSR